MAKASIWDTPIKEEESQEREYPVLEPGKYDFEVIDVQPKEYIPRATSKIGRCAQIDIRLRVEGDQDVNVFEKLFSDPKTAWKMNQFAKSIGIYSDGMTPGDIIKRAKGCIGKAEFDLEEYNGKKRNTVKAYIEQKQEAAPSASAIDNEDLPF